MRGPNNIRLDVAILGGGFAGVSCAKALRRHIRTTGLRVGLISEENYMMFQPMLPEVVGGSVWPRHVANPLRLLCPGVQIIRGKLEEIRWKDRRLTIQPGSFTAAVEVEFEDLVLALGASVDLSRIPGMPEHAYLMRNVGDAMLLRSAIIERLEEASIESDPELRARLTTVVVVGGGFSGVETAGQILDLFRGIRRFYPGIPPEEFRVHLVHSREHLLPMFNRELGDYTARRLAERGLNLVLNDRVESVTASQVRLASGRIIATNTVICTVGNAPHPLVKELIGELGLPGERGRIRTDTYCRVEGCEGLWAAGDCAAVPMAGGELSPETAQFASRQGYLLGRNIVRRRRGEPLQPFTFAGLGQLASIGHHSAVASIKGFNFSGLFAWWLWRTVYLAKLPGLDRKLRVMIDWTLELFFPRDITLLSPRYTSVLKEVHLEAGGVLFKRGERAFSLYIVKKGRLEIGDEHGVVQVIGPGEYVGERALLGDRTWHFDARASESTILVSVPARTFHQIVGGSGSLGRLFQKSAARYHSREIIEAMAQRLPARVLGRSAGEIMQADIAVMRPDMTVAEAVAVTRDAPHSAYPVVDEEGRIQGVVLREDFYEFLKDPTTTRDSTIAAVPRSALPVVSRETPIGVVLEKIIRGGVSKALVAGTDSRLEGIITLMDLIAEEKSPGAQPPDASAATEVRAVSSVPDVAE